MAAEFISMVGGQVRGESRKGTESGVFKGLGEGVWGLTQGLGRQGAQKMVGLVSPQLPSRG